MEADNENSLGLGVDLGLKDFAVISNGVTQKNINKTNTVRKTEKKLTGFFIGSLKRAELIEASNSSARSFVPIKNPKREQRKLSRKYESLKKRNKNQEGRATRQNIQKQVVVVQRIHQRLDNIRSNYINQTINELVKTKPNHITIEDLNVSGMMKNRHLSRAIASQKFYEFRAKLENKCKQHGIEVRIVDRYYPSSKKCHNCGNIKSDLQLSDRVYECSCGYIAERDYNASLNLRDAKIYKIA